MTTYRTAEEFAERFETEAPTSAGQAYPVCEYLTARGKAYRTHTTPARWLSLSDSIDRHSVTPEAIKTPVTLVGFTSDRLVPIDDIRELAARLPTLWRLVEAPSLYGHDAFLKEDEARPHDVRTTCARSGVDTDTAHGSVMPPLYLSSNYSFAGFEQKRKYDYSRSGNPTRDVLAETLAELEGGAGCVVTATGMAAVDLPLSLLEPGDLLI
eukprot:gene61251-83781_t